MTKRLVLVALGIVVLVLLLPFVFKDRTRVHLAGPHLADVKYTEVFFRNGDLALAGMLFVPAGEGPFPAAVIIHGSGTSKRDSPWYLTVARHLQANGIAVLLPDKRGSEKSRGDWTQATFADLAGDARAGVEFVRSQELFACSRVGLVGMSQGGWIAPLAAATDTSVAFVVSMSGPGVTTDEQLLYEEGHNIAQAGTYYFVGQLLAPLTASFVTRGSFWKHITGFDPLPSWRQVSVPALAAFGGGDENVPVEESVRRLRNVDNAHVAIRVYPEGGHGIVERVDPRTVKVQDAFLDDMTALIQRGEAAR